MKPRFGPFNAGNKLQLNRGLVTRQVLQVLGKEVVLDMV
jgi:hypothetical protein